MKLKLSLYINCVFYSSRIRTLVVMATYIFHRLIMGNVKIDNFFCLNGDIWNLFLQKWLLSRESSTFHSLLSKSLKGRQKGKF